MQNKIFLDTDIVLDLLLDNRENSKSTQDFLLNYLNDDTLLVISSSSLDAIYIEGSKNDQINETIELLNEIVSSKELWQIIDPSVRERGFALDYIEKNGSGNYEDLKQYFCALDSSCSMIITNNVNFPQLDLKIIRTNESLENFENRDRRVEDKEEKKGFFGNLFGNLFK
jgi:hypothetical protein